jgi:hypothetical protein
MILIAFTMIPLWLQAIFGDWVGGYNDGVHSADTAIG